MSQLDLLLQQLDMLPEKPGVYQFYNNKEEIIYVGKAKILRKEFHLTLIKRMDRHERMF